MLATRSYPFWEALTGFPAEYRIDVKRVVYGLLERLRPLEEAVGVADLMVDQAEADPATHLEKRAAEFVAAYQRLLALCYVMNGCSDGRLPDAVLFTRGLAEAGIVELHAKGCIPIIEWIENRGDSPQCPRQYAIAVSGVAGVRALAHACDAGELWTAGNHVAAIDVAAHQRQCSCAQMPENAWPRREHPWSLGTRFLDSLRGMNLARGSGLLRAVLEGCADTILGKTEHTHRLRIDAAGGARERVRERDRAVAWRRDLTYDLHLHYWQTPAGPELASVVMHNDFGIPE